MQKISVEALEKMMRAGLTRNEVDFVLYVARFQNEYGTAEGIYYRALCEEIGISYQGFYDCKRSLEEKGIIICEKRSYYDYDITILDNSFAGKENYGRGYVSLHNGMVRSEEYRKLPAPAKLMGLYLLREWMINKKKSKSDSYKMNRSTFYEKFAKPDGILNLSKRMARRYLGQLKPFMAIYLENGVKYYFTFYQDQIRSIVDTGENEELRSHSIEVACRRNRITEDGEDAHEIVEILKQHHPVIKRDISFCLSDIIRRSLETINQGIRNSYKWKRYLSPGLIHKYIMETLYEA